MDPLEYTYFNILPSELILETFKFITTIEDLTNFQESSAIIRMVYLDNTSTVNRQMIINIFPQINTVLEDEFTLNDLGNIDLKEFVGFLDVALSFDRTPGYYHTPPYMFKFHDLISRSRISEKHPKFYELIKIRKFKKMLYKPSQYYTFNIMPTYMDMMIYLESDFIRTFDAINFYTNFSKDYIFDASGIPDYLGFVVIVNPNFNPEIQSEIFLLYLMHDLYRKDIDVYRNFIDRLSLDKRTKILNQLKDDAAEDYSLNLEVYPYAPQFNDYYVDLERRL